MKHNQITNFTKLLIFLILIFLGLMSATISHAENYKFVKQWACTGEEKGNFSRPSSVAIDFSGNIYVVDSGNHRIQKFDSNGEFITSWGSYGSENGSFYWPSSIAVDSSGDVYVTDTINYRVQKFDSNGEFITSWGSYGSENVNFYWPSSVAIDSSDNVYVVDEYNGIKKFDSNGDFITSWGSYGFENGSLNWPTSVAIDSSDNVYVADSGINCIKKFDQNGSFITKWGSYGSENGSFSWVINGIAVDFAGNVYVADSENNRIQKFDSNGEFISTWGSYGSQNGSFERPGGIAVSPSNVVYIADSGNSRIQKFDSNGGFLSYWGSYGSTIGSPCGVAIGPSDNVYIVEGGSHRIQKFDSNGNSITYWGSYGYENGKFESPGGVALDSSGNVFIADSGNARIQKFDSDGDFISTWGNDGSENGSLSWPSDVAVDSSGDVYVVDNGYNRIKKFDANGNFISKWGNDGSENGNFYNPCGIAVDSSDNVYIADSGNNRIQKFDSNGEFIISWGSLGSEKGNLSWPSDVAVDSSDNVYIADSGNNRIQKFDSNGEFIISWGSFGSEKGNLSWPNSVAVDSSGNVYVADNGNNRIQKFSLVNDTPAVVIPEIIWNTPLDITSGTPLTSTQLNAVALDAVSRYPVPGNFTYIPEIETVLSAGTHTLHAYFTPESTENYTNASATVIINVTKATPEITWDNPDDIVYGTALSANQLNANGSVEGLFVYSPDNGTVLGVGKHTLDANFTPEDTANYSNVLANVTLNVTQATPEIIWDNPDDIVYGTALNDAQLNASTSAPGNFIYYPANGTVLDAGQHILHVNFTPIDATNYTNASKDVSINVSTQPVLPVANFSSNVTSGYVPLSIQFNDSSIGATSLNWDFGDGSGSKEQNPMHTYSTVGDYTVTLTVTNSNGADSKTARITVVSGKQFAYISNQYDNTVSVIDNVTNTVTATIPVGKTPRGIAINPSGTKVFVANFDNSSVSVIDTATNTVTSTVPVGLNPWGVAVNPDGEKIYVANYGDQTLSVIDTNTNSVINTVNVDSGPYAVTVNPSGKEVYVAKLDSRYVSVINTTTNSVINQIYVGTGCQGIAVNQMGTKVYVTNSRENTVSVIDVTAKSVTNIVSVGRGPGGIAVTPNGKDVYVSDWTDNSVTVIDATSNTFKATVEVGGRPYGISITPDGKKVYVANRDSNSVSIIDTDTNHVTDTIPVGRGPMAFGQFIGTLPGLEPVLPVANFTSSVTEGHAPLNVQFTDFSENATKWSWEFGDGTTSNEQNPAHTYTTAGNYTVILSVSNENGTNSTNSMITVRGEEPVYYPANSHYYELKKVPEGITWEDAKNAAQSLSYSGLNGHLATITSQDENDFIIDKFDPTFNWIGGFQPDASEEPAGGWQWTTGEPWNYANWNSGEPNNAGDGENKLHIYSNGLWNDVSNNSLLYGFIVEYEETNKPVPVPPVSNFSSNVSRGNVPLTVQFTDLSDNASEWNWSFGDGSGSTEQNPIHSYSTPGNYTVSLMVNNTAGSNVMTKQDYIIASKQEDTIIWGVVPLTLQFTDLSENATFWKWNFGDGTNSTEQNPKHTFTKAGQYAVSITVNNTAGINSATYTGYVNVVNSLEPPVAAFSASSTYGKLPLNVSFTDSSTGSPSSWKWYFGDGTNSTEQNPTHLYAKAGQYAVTLSVSNVAGSNSITKLNYISVGNSLKAPVSAFSVSIV